MFTPKSYTLINKIYDPKKDIRNYRNKVREWFEKMSDKTTDSEQYNSVLDIINKYTDIIELEDKKDIPFYEEIVEVMQLLKNSNILEEKYPRHYKEVLIEEKKERLELSNKITE